MFDFRQSKLENRCYWLNAAGIAVLLLGSYALSQYNFLLFHTLMEISSFVVAWMAFGLYWNTRRMQDTGFYLFIAIACMVGGFLDLVHALTYQGMSILPGATSDDSIQAKTAGRLIVGLSFLIAPFFLRRKIHPLGTLAAFGGIFSLVATSIFFWDLIPTGYIAGKGMTEFQHLSRGLSSALFAAAALLLAMRRKYLDRTLFGLLLASLCASFASEIASAFALDFMGILKVFAHLSQLLSLYFLYKAFIEWGIREPSAVLFQNLKSSQDAVEREALRYRSIMEASLDGIIIIDSEGYLVECNNAFLRNLGYTREETRQMHICDWNAEWSREKIIEVVHSLAIEGSTFETRHRRKDGTLMDVEINATSMLLDGKTFLCNSVRDITKRKRDVVQLRESEQRFMDVLQASHDAILLIDGERFVDCNEATCKLLGYDKREHFLKSRPSDLSPLMQPDGRNSFEKAKEMMETASQQGFHRFEWIHLKANGEEILVEVSLTPITYLGKNILHCLWHDITEIKRAEAELRDKDRRLQLFAENIDDTIWTMNFTGQLLYVSPSVERMLGYKPEEFLRLSFDRFMTPDSVKMASGSLAETFSLVRCGGNLPPKKLELEFYRKDGSTLWTEVNYNGMYDESGEIICLQGITRDITARKHAEYRQEATLNRLERLYILQDLLLLPASLEERFQLITDTAVELLDLDSCIIWIIRPGDCCESGCYRDEANELNGDLCRRQQCLQPVVTSGIPIPDGCVNRRVPLGVGKIGKIAAGEMERYLAHDAASDPEVCYPKWMCGPDSVSFGGYILWNARNQPTGVTTMVAKHNLSTDDYALMDNLAKKISKIVIDHDLEEQLQQSQKLEGVGQLAGGVAHEFNNLLQVIEGYTRYGMEGLDPREDRCRDLQQVLDAADRAANLTRQLLGFSRRKVMKLQNVDANAVVKDLIGLLRPLIGKLVTVNYFPGEGAGTIFADAVDLQQALLNLCLNARDAMPSGGMLTIATKKVFVEQPFQDSLFEIQPGHYVVFSISDTGCGIPRDLQNRIFDPFFTTKEVGKGTGLGLSMVYGMVQQHKGAIQVESEEGKGTKINLYLPCEEMLDAGSDKLGAGDSIEVPSLGINLPGLKTENIVPIG